jgi:hypothetical protein
MDRWAVSLEGLSSMELLNETSSNSIELSPSRETAHLSITQALSSMESLNETYSNSIELSPSRETAHLEGRKEGNV